MKTKVIYFKEKQNVPKYQVMNNSITYQVPHFSFLECDIRQRVVGYRQIGEINAYQMIRGDHLCVHFYIIIGQARKKRRNIGHSFIKLRQCQPYRGSESWTHTLKQEQCLQFAEVKLLRGVSERLDQSDDTRKHLETLSVNKRS